MRESNNIF